MNNIAYLFFCEAVRPVLQPLAKVSECVILIFDYEAVATNPAVVHSFEWLQQTWKEFSALLSLNCFDNSLNLPLITSLSLTIDCELHVVAVRLLLFSIDSDTAEPPILEELHKL